MSQDTAKRMATISLRCSNEAKDALYAEAERREITVSDLLNTLAERHLAAQRLSYKSDRNPLQAVLSELGHLVADALQDGAVDLQENIDLTDSATEFLLELKKLRSGVAT